MNQIGFQKVTVFADNNPIFFISQFNDVGILGFIGIRQI